VDHESELIARAIAAAPRTIAVDLDGTLAGFDTWRGFSHIGDPIASVVEAIRKEKAAGSRIILHTCRVTTLDNKIHIESVDVIRTWLKKHDVPVDEIWMSVGKPAASEYWDDRAVKKP
jgi:hypothetical protein